MKNLKLITLLLMVAGIATINSCGRVQYSQPEIANGGRAVAVTVDFSNQDVGIVASESGGLFKTTNRGRLWRHIDVFPGLNVNDVQFSPRNNNVVLAVVTADTRVQNSAGIWRSNDRGETWVRPTNHIPPVTGRAPRYNHAFSISYEAGSNRVYAGTENGIAVSNDGGQNWSYSIPDATIPVWPDSTQDRVWSVLSIGRNTALAAARTGVYRSTDGGNVWNRVGTLAVGDGITFAFAQSPLNANVVFFTNGSNRLFMSTDNGANFSALSLPSGTAEWGRPAFVKVSRHATPTKFMLYYGDGVSLWREPWNADGRRDGWRRLDIVHADPSSLAFDPTNTNAIYLTSDGGIYTSTNNGDSWSGAGSGIRGYNALQLMDVAGQQIGSTNFLYFGTQDNNILGSEDGGANWVTRPAEGFNIQCMRRAASRDASRLYYVACAGCGRFLSKPMFNDEGGWRDVTPRSSDPVMITDNVYAQFDIPEIGTRTLSVTTNQGGRWEATNFATDYDLYGFTKVSGPASNPVLFQAVKDPGWGAGDDAGVFKILKISNILSADRRVRIDTITVSGNLGVLPTMWPWYPIFTVHPTNPDYIIAPDIVGGQVMVTTNGGRSWAADATLTNLVTNGGQIMFYGGFVGSTQVRTIDFNPENTDEIVIGTYQSGIIYTRDNRRNWQRLENSEQVTTITEMFFGFNRCAYAATYGRGLYKICLDEGSSSMSSLEPVLFNSAYAQDNPIKPNNNNNNNNQPPVNNNPKDTAKNTTKPLITVSGGLIVAGQPVFLNGQRATIICRGFVGKDKNGNNVVLEIDGKMLTDKFTPDEKGMIRFEFTVNNSIGMHSITATQKTDKGLLTARADLRIAAGDSDKKKKE